MAYIHYCSRKKENGFLFGPYDLEIIGIYLRSITLTRPGDERPPVYVGYYGFEQKLTVEEMIQGFISVQDFCQYTMGIKAVHDIVDFYGKETFDSYGYNHVIEIADLFARWYIKDGFCVVYAVHCIDEDKNNEKRWRVHYVVNPISFTTRKKYYVNDNIFKEQHAYLENMIQMVTWKTKWMKYNQSVELREFPDVITYPLIPSYANYPAISVPYDGKSRIMY